MQKQSTPYSHSHPYLKNYFALIKEYEKNKATLLKEEPKKPIRNIIEDIYSKYSLNLESYVQNNKGKLQLYGSTKFENATIEAFIAELQVYKQSILKQIKSNPLVSGNMNYQLPSEEIILTPLPDQPRKFLKEKKEKEEFDSAERTAVVMRTVEYTYRFKHGDNKADNSLLNGQKGRIKNRNNKKILDDTRSVFVIVKKAVDVIQIWWKRVKREKAMNLKVIRFAWIMKLYIKKRILNRLKIASKKQLAIKDRQKKLNIKINRLLWVMKQCVKRRIFNYLKAIKKGSDLKTQLALINKQKNVNMKVNSFVRLMMGYVKRRIFNKIKANKNISKEQFDIIESQKNMNIMIQGNKNIIPKPLIIKRNLSHENYMSFITKLIYISNDIENELKMITYLEKTIKQWLMKRGNKKKNFKVKVIMKNLKKPITAIAYIVKVTNNFTDLIMLQRQILIYLTKIKIKRLRKQSAFQPIRIKRVFPLIITKLIIHKDSELIVQKDLNQFCFMTKQINAYVYIKSPQPLCLITKETKSIVKSIDSIIPKTLISTMCFITKENRLEEEYMSIKYRDLPPNCLITKERKSIMNIWRRELIQISAITKEVKYSEYSYHRLLPQLCNITKEIRIDNQSIHDKASNVNINPISIVKILPSTLSKKIQFDEGNSIIFKPQKNLISICYQTKSRVILLPKPSNIDKAVNTDIINNLNQYQITKEFEYWYRDYSSLIHSLFYVINNNYNDYLMKALIKHSNRLKKQQYLHRAISIYAKHNYLLPYLRLWHYNASIFEYSKTITNTQSNNSIHPLNYKSQPSKEKNITKPSLYQLSLGIKMLPSIFYKHSYNNIKLNANEYKFIRLIHLLTKRNQRELLYRLMLNDLITKNIDINNKPIITLIKYGNDKQYMSRLNSIFKLDLTSNNFNQTDLNFSNYIKKLIEKDEIEEENGRNLDESLTEKDSISGDENVPDTVNRLYLCRNKMNPTTKKMASASADTSEDDHLKPRFYNDSFITPVRSANKVNQSQYENTNRSKKRIFPKQAMSPNQNTILLRDMFMLDPSKI